MRWWRIEIFVDDSIRSQLFDPADFEENYHPFVHRAMNADQVLSPNGVITPTYALVSAVLLHASENASSVQAASTNEDGEAYGVLSAAVVATANVPADAVVIQPMSPPLENMEVDFAYVAASKTAFVQVHDKPQERMTYGHCLGYSARSSWHAD